MSATIASMAALESAMQPRPVAADGFEAIHRMPDAEQRHVHDPESPFANARLSHRQQAEPATPRSTSRMRASPAAADVGFPQQQIGDDAEDGQHQNDHHPRHPRRRLTMRPQNRPRHNRPMHQKKHARPQKEKNLVVGHRSILKDTPLLAS